jgi:hypothetical protein
MIASDIQVTTWLYFFSSIFQGNAALLSVLAVFVVLRLQSINSALQSLDQRIENYVSNHMHQQGIPIPVPYTDTSELPQIISQWARENEGTKSTRARTIENGPTWELIFIKRKSLVGERGELLKELAPPVILLSAVTIWALVALLNYECMSSCASGFIWLTVLLESATIFYLLYYAYRVINRGIDRKKAIANNNSTENIS